MKNYLNLLCQTNLYIFTITLIIALYSTVGLTSSFAQSLQDPTGRFNSERRGEPVPQRGAARHPLTERQRRCVALEQKLARNWINRSRPGNSLAKINQEIRKWDNELDQAENKAEDHDCYRGILFFGRRLNETPRCIRLDRRIKQAKDKLDELEEQKSSMRNRHDTSARDDIISELARYGCDERYVREDKRRFDFFSWDRDDKNEEASLNPNRQGNADPGAVPQSKILPFATYRTMCVRSCDGFFYPISFSTLPSRFPQDANVCQSKCAAPTELFVYKNPGETIEQMISLSGKPYSNSPNAFLFRKEFIKGCSCKASEYKPELLPTPTQPTTNQSVSAPAGQQQPINRYRGQPQPKNNDVSNARAQRQNNVVPKPSPEPEFNPFN